MSIFGIFVRIGRKVLTGNSWKAISKAVAVPCIGLMLFVNYIFAIPI